MLPYKDVPILINILTYIYIYENIAFLCHPFIRESELAIYRYSMHILY